MPKWVEKYPKATGSCVTDTKKYNCHFNTNALSTNCVKFHQNRTTESGVRR